MIPKDPMMLCSFLNTQLRDNYDSLDELCEKLDIDKDEVIGIMKSVDYSYNEKLNQFK